MLLPEMADKGYNSDFRLMLRYDGSLRVVTNGLSIRILDLLIRKDMNLTEVSRPSNHRRRPCSPTSADRRRRRECTIP